MNRNQRLNLVLAIHNLLELEIKVIFQLQIGLKQNRFHFQRAQVLSLIQLNQLRLSNKITLKCNCKDIQAHQDQLHKVNQDYYSKMDLKEEVLENKKILKKQFLSLSIIQIRQ